VRFVAGAAALLLAFAASPARAQWSVTPYIWAANLDADITVADRPAKTAHVPFTDLVEDVDMGVLLRVDASFGAVGGMMDLFYIHMTTTGSELPLPDGSAGTLDTKIGMTILDGAVTYDPGADGEGVSFLLGARVLGQSATLDLAVPGAPAAQRVEANDLLIDALVGAAYRQRYASHWLVDARADVGTGGTKLTWSAGAQLAYGFGSTQRFTLSAGYRYLAIDYDESSPVAVDLTMSGFITGLRIAL